MKLEILGLSKVRWPNFGEHRLTSGQILLYSGLRGEHAPRHREVGFLLSAHAHAALMKWEPINERIIVGSFRTRVRNLTMIQCYAPTDAAELEDKDNFQDPRGRLQREGWFRKLGEKSENDELFADFCGNNYMVIGGTLFTYRLVHKMTRVSRHGVTENRIDHICFSRKWRRRLLDVRTA